MDLIATQHLTVKCLEGAIGDTSSTAKGFLDSMKVRLFQTDLTPDANTPLGTLNSASATFNGYAEKTVTWADPSIADNGGVESLGILSEWRPTGSDTPNNIYGLYSLTGDGSLGLVGRFDEAPIPMGSVLDQLTVTLRFRPLDGGTTAVIS